MRIDVYDFVFDDGIKTRREQQEGWPINGMIRPLFPFSWGAKRTGGLGDTMAIQHEQSRLCCSSLGTKSQ